MNGQRLPASIGYYGKDLEISFAKLSNFTFVFGCNPADGVKADNKFVKLFV
jgi:hypothetical protein